MAFLFYEACSGIKAFTTDRSVDFRFGEEKDSSFSGSGHVLTLQQKEILVPVFAGASEKLVFPEQVHGVDVRCVTDKDAGQRCCFKADAVVTCARGVPVAIRTADCLPLLLWDSGSGVIAAVHAGWQSTRLLIVKKTVELMVCAYGLQPRNIFAQLGPCIRQDSYSVSAEFCEYFPQDVVRMQDGWHFDLAGANMRQLLTAGVIAENIRDCGLCTFKDAGRFFSYRREGERSGRLLNAIMLSNS